MVMTITWGADADWTRRPYSTGRLWAVPPQPERMYVAPPFFFLFFFLFFFFFLCFFFFRLFFFFFLRARLLCAPVRSLLHTRFTYIPSIRLLAVYLQPPSPRSMAAVDADLSAQSAECPLW